jgi:dihydroorotase
MSFSFKGVNMYKDHGFIKGEVSIHSNSRVSISEDLLDTTVDADGIYVLPGFADVHVHLREPGFSYKETIISGSRAAASGGYTTVCTMPNLNPVPDSMENLKVQLDIIESDSCINIRPFGSISEGQQGKRLADMSSIAPYVAGFSDDGYGVQDSGLMREAMAYAKSLNKIIAAHCEDTAYEPADPRSEWKEVERDILLSMDTGCPLHICHVSSASSIELVRQAKKSGIDVTCETAPHYLILDNSMVMDNGNWKMNPPIRDKSDKEALLEGLTDGTIDMIATDHAPHSASEKNRSFAESLNGIVGLECAFPVLYTYLVKRGVLSLEQLVYLMSISPRKRFSLAMSATDFTVFDLNAEYTVDSNHFLSLGRSTPFNGWNVNGKCMLTVVGGEIAFNYKRKVHRTMNERYIEL